MKITEYKLLDGRTIRAKYDRVGMCKLSRKNMEAFVKEFNEAYRQAKLLEEISSMGEWIVNKEGDTICCPICNDKHKIGKDEVKLLKTSFSRYNFCTYCGAKLD